MGFRVGVRNGSLRGIVTYPFMRHTPRQKDYLSCGCNVPIWFHTVLPVINVVDVRFGPLDVETSVLPPRCFCNVALGCRSCGLPDDGFPLSRVRQLSVWILRDAEEALAPSLGPPRG